MKNIVLVSYNKYPIDPHLSLSSASVPPDSPVIEEIDFVKNVGEDSASSFREGSEPSQAFLPSGNGWMADKSELPAFIWRAFSHRKVRPSRISFLPRQGEGLPNAVRRMPSKYEFIGSNESPCRTDGNWVVLCKDLSGERITGLYQARGCEVEEVHRSTSFQCVGLKILQKGGGETRYTTALRKIRMWGVLD